MLNSFDDNKILPAPPPFLPKLLFPFSILWLQPTDQTGRISDRISTRCVYPSSCFASSPLWIIHRVLRLRLVCAEAHHPPHCLSESHAATLLGLWSLNLAVHVTITQHLLDTYVLSPLACVLPSCRTFADFGPAGLTHYTNTPILTPFRGALGCK
jgi:hypothetical protein